METVLSSGTVKKRMKRGSIHVVLNHALLLYIIWAVVEVSHFKHLGIWVCRWIVMEYIMQLWFITKTLKSYLATDTFLGMGRVWGPGSAKDTLKIILVQLSQCLCELLKIFKGVKASLMQHFVHRFFFSPNSRKINIFKCIPLDNFLNYLKFRKLK